jgi:hypothetical protein
VKGKNKLAPLVGLKTFSTAVLTPCVLILLLLLVGCSEQKGDFGSGPAKVTETTDRKTIEAYARVKIPASATDLQASLLTGWLDDSASVKFKLPISDLDPFLKSAGYIEPLEDNFSPIGRTNSKEISWWKPGDAKAFAGTEVMEAGFTKKIMVDKTNPQLLIIYLNHFEF